MKDKRQQIAILQRKRGKVAQAVRNIIDVLGKLGIKCEVKASEGKDTTFYVIIEDEGIARAIANKVTNRLKRIDRNVKTGHVFEDKILMLIIEPSVKLNVENLEEIKNEVKSWGIIDSIDYTDKVFVGIKVTSIADKLNEILINELKKRKINVSIATIYEDRYYVIVVRK